MSSDLSADVRELASNADKVFPEDLAGKTVLVLGSDFEFFCIEAVKRGAARVAGFDVDPARIESAKLAAEGGGLNILYELRDVERRPLTERFDYVLCLDLIQRFRQPINVLDAMLESAREHLILETPSLGSHDRRDRRTTRLSWLQQKIAARLPVIVVTRAGARAKREAQNFFFTEKALENLLMYQRGQCASVDIQPSNRDGRYIATARKRQIGHLLIVSSPTSAGKKTLMRKLIANELPDLARAIGTVDASVWGVPINSAREATPVEPKASFALLHHDFLRPVMRGIPSHERDEALDLLKVAKKITFVTVWTAPEFLARQISDAEIRSGRPLAATAHHRRIRDIYLNDPDRVRREYLRWFEFTERWSDHHLVVSSRDQYRWSSINDWRAGHGSVPFEAVAAK